MTALTRAEKIALQFIRLLKCITATKKFRVRGLIIKIFLRLVICIVRHIIIHYLPFSPFFVQLKSDNQILSMITTIF